VTKDTKPKHTAISWTAREFIHYPKGKVWIISLLSIGLVLVGIFLFRKDFLTALLFLLLLIVTFYFSRKKPRKIKITLDSQGIKLNELRIYYQQIKNFWIIYRPPEVKTLNFETSAYINRFLTIQLEAQDPLKIREYLLNFISEELDREEPVTEKLSRKLKF